MKVLNKVFLVFSLICSMFSLSSCFNRHTITYHIDELGIVDKVKVFEDDTYKLDVKQINYYKFVGYYDIDGAKYTDEFGKSLFGYDLEENLELYAKYIPCEYTIKIDPLDAENYNEFGNMETKLQIGDDIPSLPSFSKTKYDLIGFQAEVGEEKVMISEGTTFLEGFDILSDLYLFGKKNENLDITLKPIFDKQKYQMSFNYIKDGKQVSEDLKVYIETDIKEAAPKYIDQYGNTHHYLWKTAEQLEENNPYSFYKGETKQGLTLYAEELYNSYDITDTSFPYLIETYSLDLKERTLHLPNKATLNVNVNINIDKYIDDYQIKAYGNSHYNGITFTVLERESDINISINSNSTTELTRFTPISKHSIIDASSLGHEQLMVLNIDGKIQFNGINGTNGKNGKDESGGAEVGGSSNLDPAESGTAGEDGTSCIVATNVQIVVPEESTLNLIAGNGGHGGNGGIPRPTDQKGVGSGANGGSGGLGGDGGHCIQSTYLIIDVLGTMNVAAGNGGNGGAGGRGSYAVGGFFHDVDCAGDGGSGNNGGNGGYCFKIRGYEISNYANGTLKAGSAGNGGDGGNGGDAGNSTLYGEGPGGLGGNGGNAGVQGDIGLKESIGNHLTYVGSYTKDGGDRGNNGYSGDGTNDHLGSEYTKPGYGSYGILFGVMWTEK